MFAPYCIVLLLFQYAVPSFQFDNSGCSSWLCLVNGKCASATDDRWLMVAKYDKKLVKDACKTMVEIRKVDTTKAIVIITYRKIIGTEAALRDLKLIVKSKELFGCEFDDGKKIKQVADRDVMELVESHSNVTQDIFTCAGYVKGTNWEQDAGTILQFKLAVTLSGPSITNYVNADTSPTPDPTLVPLGCDLFLVNSLWKDELDEDYLNKQKVALSRKDNPGTCGSLQLYFKRGLDVIPQPVREVKCRADQQYQYSVEIHGSDQPEPTEHHPFLLFCAENVNHMCPKPAEIQCGKNCTQVEDNKFVKGTALIAPKLECPEDSYVVKEGAKEHRVSGTPLCQGNPSNRKEPVWTIPSFEGQLLTFSAAACEPELTCWKRVNLKWECKDDAERKCTQGAISQSGASCPNGTFVGVSGSDKEPKITKSQVISCDTNRFDWQPAIDSSGKVGCYFDFDREPQGVPSSWTKQKIGFVGFGGLSIVVLLLATIIVLIYLLVIRKRAQNAGKTSKTLLGESSGRVSTTNPDGTEKDALTIRKEQCPGVEERLLRRRSERTKLTFENLSFILPNYINDVFLEEFEEYSIHERTKFAEGIADGMGQVTVMQTFLELFLHCLGKEDEIKVWYHLVTGIRIVWIALKMKKATKVGERLLLALRQFGLLILSKYGAFPLQGESDDVSEKRSFAYYALLRANCQEMVVKMCQLYDTMLGDATPSLRRMIWTTMVRKKDKFDEVKEFFNKEVANPTRKDDIRWGTKRDDLIYALCSTTDRDKSEPFLATLIRDPQFTAKEVLTGFTAMVRDFDDCHDGAKYLFTERHNLIKAKVPVATEEYKQIFQMFYQFATISLSNDDWLPKFMSADETFTPEERKLMESHLAKAVQYGEAYKLMHKMCFKKRKGVDLRKLLEDAESKYLY